MRVDCELPAINRELPVSRRCLLQASLLVFGLTQRPEVWLTNVALYSRSSLATTQAEPPAPCGYYFLLG